MSVISKETWGGLVDLNSKVNWAEKGVFATGVGREYKEGKGLLYIGKSAGPLGSSVGSNYDQMQSSAASTSWMVQRRNKSAFWQFVDRIDPSRLSLAWTNLSKMDSVGGKRPPNFREWSQINSISMKALREEIENLKPKVSVFATSGLFSSDVSELISGMGYINSALSFEDGWTSLYTNKSGQSIFLTKHPQGWPNAERDRVILEVKNRLLN